MPRILREAVSDLTAAPLEIDRAAGIIKGVRVLGAESRNTHGERGVEGTEYAPSAHADARRIYEGLVVHCDHNTDPARRNRRVDEPFGVLRNVREARDAQGRVVTDADLHFYTSHRMAATVLEDVERKIGNYGLSHDATSSRDRIDRTRKRLVIEGLASARSVDLVFRPASNRNLWEQETSVKTPIRQLIEQLAERFGTPKTGKPKPNKAAWAKHLLEDDGMAGPLAAEVEMPGDDPEEAVEDAFCAAVAAVVRGDGSAEDKLAKIEVLLKAQEALDGEGDAAEGPAGNEPPKDEPKQEQLDEKDRELTQLRAEKSVRQLCEQESFAPTQLQLDALVAIADKAKQRKLIESFRAGADRSAPRSGTLGRGPTGGMPAGDGFTKAVFK